MKRLVLLVVVALGMSATSFAGEKVEGKDWKVDVNVAKLSKYLNLDARQMEEVANISDYFADKVQSASYAKEAKQGKKIAWSRIWKLQTDETYIDKWAVQEVCAVVECHIEKQRVGFLYGRCGE